MAHLLLDTGTRDTCLTVRLYISSLAKLTAPLPIATLRECSKATHVARLLVSEIVVLIVGG
jgi:hypothetical protein